MRGFYDGRKVEVETKCKNCKKDIVWYEIFPQAMGSHLIANIVSCEENVSGAKLVISEQTDEHIKVTSEYRCRYCDELHSVSGTIVNNKRNRLTFIKDESI